MKTLKKEQQQVIVYKLIVISLIITMFVISI